MVVHLLVAPVLAAVDVTRVDAHEGVDQIAGVGDEGEGGVDDEDYGGRREGGREGRREREGGFGHMNGECGVRLNEDCDQTRNTRRQERQNGGREDATREGGREGGREGELASRRRRTYLPTSKWPN